MDQIDAFPEHISTTVMPVTLPEKPDALEYAARQGHVRACIIYQEPNTKRVFVLFCKDNWYQKKTLLDNFKRAIFEAKHVNSGPTMSCGRKSPKDSVEKFRSTPEKYRQEDGIHLKQHVFCEKRLYYQIPNGKVWRDSPDSNDPRPHADL
ncbi:uncharacterized protein TNCV_2255411 [Trichonephila clavipes]|nr:uncharacterized protein TNCV_2255411 [Trichonephila clavipes]